MFDTKTYLPNQVFFSRRQDGWFLGSLLLNGDPQVSAMRQSALGATSAGHFPSIDAAERWIATNPMVPDLTLTPEMFGVYGPTLATWAGYTLVGQVWSNTVNIAQGLGSKTDLVHAAFVVVSDSGGVWAKIVRTDDGWSMVVGAVRDQKPIRRQRKNLGDVLDLLATTVARHIAQTSAHALMDIRATVPDLVPVAEAFLAQRSSLQAHLLATTNVQEEAAQPHATRIHSPLVLTRYTDGFRMGSINSAEDGYTVERLGLTPGREDVQDHVPAPSLEAALHLLTSNPYAPDLEKFPVGSGVYGPVLWSLRNMEVRGQVALTRSSRLTAHMPFVVRDFARHETMGLVEFLPNSNTWQFLHLENGLRITTTPDADLSAVLSRMQDTLLGMHAPTMQKRLRPGAAGALSDMLHFIATRDAQV